MTAGFTLAELIMSVAIVAVIMTIVIVNQAKYSEATVLSNITSALALSAREAQVYGVSVREVAAGTNEFTAGYGLHFNLTGGSNDAYILYADRELTKNNMYDNDWSCPQNTGTEIVPYECLSKTTLQSGYTISAICSVSNSDTENCTLTRADITFVRPDPDAQLVLFDASGFQLSSLGIKAVRIKLASPSNLEQTVSIYTTGQISIQ